MKTLKFKRMGMDFQPKDKEHIGNHRIRSEFKNRKGIKCFIEVGANAKDNSLMRCDHSIYNIYTKQEKNNYQNLERSIKGDYTFENLLKIVNENFDCDFEKIEVSL